LNNKKQSNTDKPHFYAILLIWYPEDLSTEISGHLHICLNPMDLLLFIVSPQNYNSRSKI